MKWLCVLGLFACSSSSHDSDVTGPFTGAVHRFAIDRFDLPLTNAQAYAFADDLDGNHSVDNQLGQVIASLGGVGDITMHGADVLASGVIASSVLIQAGDLDNADVAGVTYLGADGDASGVMGATIVDGTIATNRSLTTRVRGTAALRLPVFQNADPSLVSADWMEMDLTRDGAGYSGVVRGLVTSDARRAAATGIIQMVASDPKMYPNSITLFDTNVDGVLELDEVEQNQLLLSLLAPDVTRDGVTSLSFGFGIHLQPCDSGPCSAPPADRCFDRTLDGDETDVDCGGSCLACPGGASCKVAGDCQSQVCTGGVCAAPTCSDGVLDGFETDVDCGWNCARCESNRMCLRDGDCLSDHCTGGRCD
jgi:hypothetical protein